MRILSLHTSSLRKTEDSSQAGADSLFLSLPNLVNSIFFSDGVVSVESCPGSSGWPETLKLLEGPGYQPSYAR